MKKIDIVNKLTQAAGISAEHNITFYNYFLSETFRRIDYGDFLKVPEVGEFHKKKGAFKNEEMDEVDYENTWDIIITPVKSINLIFMFQEMSESSLPTEAIFSAQLSPDGVFDILPTDDFPTVFDKIFKNSIHNVNKIVGQEYFVIGQKELSVLDADYEDEIGKNDSEKIEPILFEAVPNIEPVTKIRDDYDYDFNEKDFEKVDPFEINSLDRFPIDKDLTKDKEELEEIESHHEGKPHYAIDEEIDKIKIRITSEVLPEETDKEQEAKLLDGFVQDNPLEVTHHEPEVIENRDEFIRQEESEIPVQHGLGTPEEELEKELKKRRSNLLFIGAVTFLVILLFGFLIFYKMGGSLSSLFGESKENKGAQVVKVNTVDRKYDIPVSYNKDHLYQGNNKEAANSNADIKKEENQKPASQNEAEEVKKKEETSKKEDVKKKEEVKKESIKKEEPKKEQVKKEAVKKEIKTDNTKKENVKTDEGTGAPILTQISSWKDKTKAEQLAAKYRGQGYDAYVKPAETGSKGLWYRIYINFDSKDQKKKFKE